MWYKLNEWIGVGLLVLAVGGGAIYGLTAVLTAPPLLRQDNQQSDARKTPYTRGMMNEHDRRMREIQDRSNAAISNAIETGRRAQGL